MQKSLSDHNRINSSWLSATVEDIERASALPALEAAVLRIKAAVKADFVALIVRVPVRLVEPIALVITDYPSEWITRYRENHYGLIDPVLLRAQESVHPLKWSDITPATEEQGKLMMEALEFGLRDGVTFTLHAPNGTSLFFSFAFKKPPHRFDARIRALKPTIHSLLPTLHDTSMRLISSGSRNSSVSNSADVKLTEREEFCLLWSADGKTAWEIGKLLGVSERTVNGYFEDILRKLDAMTRTQAVAKAIAMGHIRPSLTTGKSKVYWQRRN